MRPTRKNTRSPWNIEYDRLLTLTRLDEDRQERHALADKIAAQLAQDAAAMLAGLDVSNLCLLIPRSNHQPHMRDFFFRLTDRLHPAASAQKALDDSHTATTATAVHTSPSAQTGHPEEQSRPLDQPSLPRIIAMRRRLSDLARYYTARELARHEAFQEQIRARVAHPSWCSLKNRPPGVLITRPQAMPVTEANPTDLEPIFSHIAADGPACPNTYDTVGKEMCMKFTRGSLYEDGRMDLCKQVVGPTSIGNLMHALRSNSHISHFLLGNNIIGSTGAQAIAAFINDHTAPRMQTWYLAGNELDAEGIRLICDALIASNDTACNQLWLKRNPLGPTGGLHLAHLLHAHHGLQVLDLHNTGLMDDGLDHLLSGLRQNRTLRFLYLDACGFSAAAGPMLADYFRFLTATSQLGPGVTNLWVDMNQLDDAGCEALLEALTHYTPLEGLCMGSNGCTDVTAKAAYHAFHQHPSLQVLDLGMYKSTTDMGMVTNRLGDSGAQWMAKMVTETKSLQYLNLSQNIISDEGLAHLVEAAEINTSLIALHCHELGYRYDDSLLARLGAALKRNRRSRGIVSNETTDEFTEYVRKLRHGPMIHKIDSIYRNNPNMDLVLHA
jgi:Ran GTPase-activating protein (RanGAP) involved in mRNA processing and transport